MMLWKIVTVLLILGSISQSESLTCMHCNHTSLSPNSDCVQGTSSGLCLGANHCMTYFGNVTFSEFALSFDM